MGIPYAKGWLEDKITRACGRKFIVVGGGDAYTVGDDRWQDFYEAFEELTGGKVTLCKDEYVQVEGDKWCASVYHEDKEYALLYLTYLFSTCRLD